MLVQAYINQWIKRPVYRYTRFVSAGVAAAGSRICEKNFAGANTDENILIVVVMGVLIHFTGTGETVTLTDNVSGNMTIITFTNSINTWQYLDLNHIVEAPHVKFTMSSTTIEWSLKIMPIQGDENLKH